MTKFIFETEDKQEAELHLKAGDYKLILWDLDNWLRNHVKYNPDELSGPQLDILDKTREELRDIMFRYNVSLD